MQALRITPAGDEITAIKLSQREIQREIKELRQEVKQDVDTLLQEVRQNSEALRQDLKQDISMLHHSIKNDIGHLRHDLHRLQQNARADFRLLFGALISIGVGMSGLVARAFHWI
ncbi:hypothetical protein [Erwinia tasmaniensis]|uniref:Uncharacterized protein n=1 Tax=Erwinia tasmaniensis (strain DSM 17950 / CFBP 7177 / CIP 109463 / NCPPB 4357 / Et1/99) TaxID=465817 RepID=B2VEP1_ERWT9|nr:hypothetical protein [Erwinia tasmaniensis]CAO96841.1 Hypothetical protein ETA_17950 [Erwinia tasmaniensis Et1/99]